MRAVLLAVALLTGCEHSSSYIAERQYPGLTCFSSRGEFALCVDRHSGAYVCFVARTHDLSFCLKATEPPNELERDR